MATYNWGFDKSFLALTDLSAKQYYFVKASSTVGYVEAAATAAASVLGVLQNDPKAGEEASVRIFGTTRVMGHAESAASPVVCGGLVKCASSGQATGMLNPAASTFAVGVALESLATGSGVQIEILLLPPGTKMD